MVPHQTSTICDHFAGDFVIRRHIWPSGPVKNHGRKLPANTEHCQVRPVSWFGGSLVLCSRRNLPANPRSLSSPPPIRGNIAFAFVVHARSSGAVTIRQPGHWPSLSSLFSSPRPSGHCNADPLYLQYYVSNVGRSRDATAWLQVGGQPPPAFVAIVLAPVFDCGNASLPGRRVCFCGSYELTLM